MPHSNSSRFFIWLGATLLVVAAPLLLWAQSTLVFDADFMERNSSRGIIRLKGNVQVIYDQQVLNCDEAILHLEDEVVEIEGSFVLQGPDLYVQGERARLNLKTKTGTVYDGFVRSGQVLFEGAVIHRLGEKNFEAEKAYYTSCLTCPPGWSFTGRTIHAEMGGYARISRPVFRVAHVPVIWLPYLIVPLKTERQTGLLVPTYGFSSSSGTIFGMNFFWAMGRSHDSTWGLRYHEKRGIHKNVNYRYVLSPTSSGELNVSTIEDRVFRQESRLGPRKGEYFRRWSVGYEHFFDFGDGLTQTAKINAASDLLYPRDFPDEIEGLNDPALENRFTITKNMGNQLISVQTNVYTNLIKEDVLSSNDDTVHRFPQFRYSVRESRIFDSPVLFSFDMDYVNFVRNSLSYDEVVSRNRGCSPNCLNMEKDSSRSFDPSQDILRTGERLDLKPSLAYLVPLGKFFDITPWATYRYTQYSFPLQSSADPSFDSTPHRHYLETGASLRTSVSRVFRPSDDPNASSYKHELKMNLSGSGVPYFDRTDHVFFGNSNRPYVLNVTEPVSDNAFYNGDELQFDSYDQVTANEVVELTLDNLFTEKYAARNTYGYRQLVFFRLSQSYDLTEAKKELGLPWSPIKGILDVRYRRFNANILAYYFPYLNKVNSSSRLRLSDQTGNFVQVSFTQSYTIPRDPADFDYDSRRENLGVGVGLKSRYLDLTTSADFETRTGEINSWTMHGIITPPGECWKIHSLVRQLSGSDETIFNFSFEFDFGGNS